MQQIITAGRIYHGDKYDPSELDPKFAPYYHSGQRIIIRDKYGAEHRGYVGITTGWRQAFLLVHNTRSLGSSYLLRSTDEVIGTVNRYRGRR